MPQFRKKPVVIEAFQYCTDGPSAVPDWFCDAQSRGDAYFTQSGALAPLAIKTLNGFVTVMPGEWIVKGVQGELYPCASDIFEATYEPVVNTQPTAS
jgi:hypothetical protein